MRYIFFLILAVSSLSHAQSTLRLDSVAFHSTFEFETVKNALNTTADPVALFSVLDERMDEVTVEKNRKKWDELIQSIRTEKFLRKNREKQVREIYSTLHDALLVKYQLTNQYPEIFTDGYYNCVSATAMYAMALDEFDIPYQIKETPTHVYLVAYPEEENIMLESTDPQNGYIKFDPAFKKTYVENLASAKLISQSELRSGNTDNLFEKHYFANENIGLNELAGIQYANDALVRLENEQLEDAFFQLEKAYLLYPADRYRLFLVALSIEILHSKPGNDPETALYYSRIARYNKTEVKTDEMIGEYMRISEALLSESYLPEKLSTWVDYQEKNLEWPEVMDKIRFLYDYETGRVAYNRGEFKTALTNFGKVLDREPSNPDVQNAFIAALEQRLSTISSGKEEIELLESAGNKHPALTSNINFMSMLSFRYLRQFAMSYDLNQPAEGESYREAFETSMKPDLLVDRNDIGRAYSIAAVYYFKRGNTRKARELINRGLELAPDNYELLVRKQAIR